MLKKRDETTYSEGIQQNKTSELRQRNLTKFLEKGHGQWIFMVSWREIRKWPEPKGDRDCNVWVTGTQSQAREVESELRLSVILSRQEWVRQTDIWGCSFQRRTGKCSAGEEQPVCELGGCAEHWEVSARGCLPREATERCVRADL